MEKKFKTFIFFIFVVTLPINSQSEHPAKIEKTIINKIARNFKNRNYAEALIAWKKHENKYRSSILFYYWGGLVHLFNTNGSRNEMILNYKKGIKLLLMKLKKMGTQ